MLKFRVLLWLIGLLLWLASRLSARVQSQLSRDMTLVIGSEDGVWRTYHFSGRRTSSRAGSAANAALTLTFKSGDLGFRVLLAVNTIDQLLDGFGTRDIVCKGEAAVILWFYELVMGLKPWRRKPVDVWPDSYDRPDSGSKVADRIIREPVADTLDPDWRESHEQREKTLLWQVGLGAVPAGKFIRHRIVIDLAEQQDVPAR
jgi:hypothetical protein